MNETTNTLDVSVEQPGGLERTMTVRVPNIEIEKEISLRLTRVGRTARIKGFRPGKVPAKVVRQRYGDQVRQEVISDVIRSSYSQALQQENLAPAGGPAIEPVTGVDDGLFAYKATFEVYPEIELAPLDKLRIEKPVVAIGDSDVDEMVQRLRDQRAQWNPVERKSADGDRVITDFKGTIGKEAFEGGEGSSVPIVVGAGQVIADFEKALKGMQAGETKSAKVKFPKDYPVETLAGKKAVFEITVQAVEEKELPEVDDEFLAAFGVKEGGLDAFREQLRENMGRELAQRLRSDTRRRALDSLLDANRIEVPKALVEQEITAMQAHAMRQLNIEDPAEAPPRGNFADAALRRATLGLLVQELIRANEITLDRTRLDDRIDELVSQFEQRAEAARAYRADRNLMAQLEASVLEEQVVDFLLENAKTSEKSMDFSEFMAV